MQKIGTARGALLLPISVIAQSAEHATEDALTLDDLSPMQTLEQTVAGIVHNFVEHTPYLFAGLVVLLLTWLLAALVGKIVFALTGRGSMRTSLRELLQRLSRIVVWALGLLLAAMVIFPGLTPTKAIGGLGLASVAIGFAFKEIFENFFAGILLLWKYPFENGDFIECEGLMGKVEDISIRMSKIRKTNGELVLVPNSFLFKNPVRVLTDLDVRRITITTGVAYGEDAQAALELIQNGLKDCKTISNDHPVEVLLSGFGASSMDIEVTWWTEPKPLQQRESISEVVGTIKKTLDEAGIEIPFPYRTMTFSEPLTIRQSD